MKAWESLEWSLVNGHKYTQDPNKKKSPDKGKEDAEEIEYDREEGSGYFTQTGNHSTEIKMAGRREEKASRRKEEDRQREREVGRG
jgi:hypothetical protein